MLCQICPDSGLAMSRAKKLTSQILRPRVPAIVSAGHLFPEPRGFKSTPAGIIPPTSALNLCAFFQSSPHRRSQGCLHVCATVISYALSHGNLVFFFVNLAMNSVCLTLMVLRLRSTGGSAPSWIDGGADPPEIDPAADDFSPLGVPAAAFGCRCRRPTSAPDLRR